MKTYWGTRDEDGCLVTVIEEGAKYRERDLRHRVRHSPTGFEWGYGGSGPADLARSLLWDHLGHEPEPRLYMAFKFQVIGGLPKAEWELTSKQVDEWLMKYKETNEDQGSGGADNRSGEP